MITGCATRVVKRPARNATSVISTCGTKGFVVLQFQFLTWWQGSERPESLQATERRRIEARDAQDRADDLVQQEYDEDRLM